MADKKNYYVRIPLAGVLGVEVQASSEEEAKELALETEWEVDLRSTLNNVEIEELDLYKKTCKGNVNCTSL